MSRIAKNPVTVPESVEVAISAGSVQVKGKNGTLTQAVPPVVEIRSEGDKLLFKALDQSKKSVAMSGTLRAIVANMVIGVDKGNEKKLQLVGVGYRAQASGNKLNLNLGYSHPIEYSLPDGITAETPSQTEIVIKGANKQQVGQVAAEIRSLREPEPYKGKGVRYADERIVIKETKKK